MTTLKRAALVVACLLVQGCNAWCLQAPPYTCERPPARTPAQGDIP